MSLVAPSVVGMSQAAAPYRHPLVRAVEGVRDLLDDVAGANPVFLTTEDKQEVLLGLTRQIARLEALRAKTLAVADDVAERHGTRHAGAGSPTRPGRTPRRVGGRSGWPTGSTGAGPGWRMPTWRVRCPPRRCR